MTRGQSTTSEQTARNSELQPRQELQAIQQRLSRPSGHENSDCLEDGNGENPKNVVRNPSSSDWKILRIEKRRLTLKNSRRRLWVFLTSGSSHALSSMSSKLFGKLTFNSEFTSFPVSVGIFLCCVIRFLSLHYFFFSAAFPQAFIDWREHNL